LEKSLDRIRVTEGKNYRNLLYLAVFIFLVPAWAKLLPGDVIHIDIVNIMVLAGIYASAVIGLNLLIGYAGQISLGHAAFFGIGAYTTAILCTHFTWFPTWLGVMLGAALAGSIGWLVGVPVLRLKGHYLAMATLGLGEIAFILFTQLKWLTGGTIGIPQGLNVAVAEIPPFSIFGLRFDSDLKFFYLAWAIVMLLMLFNINMIRSRVGRGLRALHSSEVAADAMGINTGKYKTQVFILSAAFAGLGGALFAHFQRYINPESFTLSISILFVTMVVVGGMGNLWGGIVGVVVLTMLPSVIQAFPQWIPGIPSSLTNFSNYSLVLYGALLVVFMIFMPQGLAAGISRGVVFSERRFRKLRDRVQARKYEGH
jgi:branched-chain amino acid transport system permease protein